MTVGVLFAFGSFLVSAVTAEAAVAFDAFSEDGNVAAGSTVDFSWTHTPVGTPRGVLVYIVQNTSAADRIDSVTYGSLTLTRVARACDTVTEPACVYAYVGTSSIPTGAQTVSVNETGGGGKHAVAYTFTAGADTEVVAFDNSIVANAVNPSVTVPLSGRTAHVSLGLFSGLAAVTGITPLSGWTSRDEEDFGAQLAGFYTYDTVASTDVTAGWTQATDDAAMVAVALAEVMGEPSGGPITLSGTLYESDGSTPITATSTVTASVVTPLGTETILSDWATTTAAGNDDFWQSITYGNGTYVAVATGLDQVMTSSDGITWATSSAAGNDDQWLGVTYGNGLFVAVGVFGDRVMTSSDGITWATSSAAGNNDSWWDVTYGNGLFVAVGSCLSDVECVMTSSDGITWTVQSAAGNDDFWQSVTYGNGLFVAVGSFGDRVITSSNGITWTVQSAAGNNDTWQSVTYGNGLFVTVGTGPSTDGVMTSLDGITWTVRSAAGDDDLWYDVTYGNGLFVAVGEGPDTVMTSPDGINWTARPAAGDNDGWLAVTFANNRFVAVGNSGDRVMYADSSIDVLNTFSTTTDAFGNFSLTLPEYQEVGLSGWSTTTAAGDNDMWNSVTYNNGLYVAVGITADRVMTSVDGFNWATSTAAGDNDTWRSVTYANGLFVAVGGCTVLDGSADDCVMTSSDGVAWTARPAAGNNDRWQSVTYGNGLFVAVGVRNLGTEDVVMTSSDGINWATSTAAGDNDSWRSVTYANGLFVAVGDSGDRVMTSSNGINWTVQSAADNNDNWQSVTYGNGLFVAVGNSGSDRVMVSTDGITWATSTAAGNNDSWQSVTYSNGLFVAVGTGLDRVMTSPDGVTWTVRTAVGNNDSWQSVTYGNGQFVAVSSSGDRVMYAEGTPAFNETTPLTLFVDESATTSATTLTYLNGETDILDIDLWSDTVRLQHSSTTGEIDLGTAAFYDFDDDGDVLFDVDGATTSIGSTATSAALLVASSTIFAPTANLTLNGDFTQNGSIDFSETTLIVGGSLPQLSGNFSGSNTLGDVVIDPTGTDGWVTQSAAGNNEEWYGVAYGTNTFVAVGIGGLSSNDEIMYSMDGISWATTTTDSPFGLYLGLDIIYAGGQFVSVGIPYVGLTPSVAVSPDGINWTSGSAAGDNDNWFGVTYGNGTYVAVGTPSSFNVAADDVVMYSTNGLSWATTTAAGNNDYWSDAAYGNDTFVAVGNGEFGDAVMTSPDGITWTAQATDGDTDNWQGVTYGNGTFVAVGGGSDDYVMTSPDGIIWTTQTAPVGQWKDVIYEQGYFTAVGVDVSNNAQVMTSLDGISWATSTVAGTGVQLEAVSSGAGTSVAVAIAGTQRVMYEQGGIATIGVASTSDLTIAPDTTLISTTSLSVAGDLVGNGSLLNDGTLFLSGSNKTVSTAVATPELGDVAVTGTIDFITNVSVTDLTISSSGTLDPHTELTVTGDFTQNGDIDFSNTTLYLSGSDSDLTGDFSGTNRLYDVVVDGVFQASASWNSISAVNNDDAWLDIAYGNGTFVAVGDATGVGDAVMTSPDGETWTAQSAAGNNDAWAGVTYGNGQFVAVGNGPGTDRVMTSSDGITWIVQTIASVPLQSVTYGDGLFVAVSCGLTGEVCDTTVSTENRIYTSSDGVTWTDRSAAGNDDSWTGVTYGDGLFVAVAATGTTRIMTSPDGINWTAQSALGNDDDWQSVTYGNGQFVAVGALGPDETGDVIMYSNNGTDWSLGVTPGFAGFLYDVEYGNNEFIAVGSTIDFDLLAFVPTAITSSDGITWGPQSLTSSAGDQFATGVTFGEGLYVVVGFRDDGGVNSLINNRQVIGQTANIVTASTSDVQISQNGSLKVTDELSILGDFTNAGSFEPATSTVVFGGVAAQVATGTLEFYNLTVTNESQNGSTTQSVTYGAPLTVTNTYTMLPGTSAAFLAGATSTIQNIDLAGTAGNEVYLRSTASGTAWGLDVSGSQINVEFVDVKDSFASTSISATSSVDGGNNTNWFFVNEAISGSSTIANHDQGQVSNAFNFQNKTDEELFAFKLIPESGTATLTSLTFDLSGVTNIDSADFTNIRLVRDLMPSGEFNGGLAGDEVIAGTGVMIIDAESETGTIVFNEDFVISTSSAQNYLVVADWNAPPRDSAVTINLYPGGVVAEDENGVQDIFGSVSPRQHSRFESRGGGGGRASDIGGEAPVGDGIVVGGGAGPGEQIGNDPNFRRPTGGSGWRDIANSYDGVDETRAIANNTNPSVWQNHSFPINTGNTIQGIEIKLEIRSSNPTAILSAQLSWDGGSSWTDTKELTNVASSDVVLTAGGPSDLWGRTPWSVAEFSNTNFRVRLTADQTSVFSLDEIQVRVYNQASGGGSGGGADI